MKSERVTAVAWAWSSSMRTFRVALSCFLLVQFGLPVWADGSPSLQDLIKGTAPPLPLEEQKSGDNLPELPQTLPASTINPPASNIPGGFSSGKAPLQGEVDALDAAPSPSTLKLKTLEAMPAPVLPKKPLQAVIQTRQMNSSAEDDDEDLKGLKPSLGSMDQQRNLKSGASMDDLNKGLASEDPDVEDQEMMVQWDKWHNRVLNAIQQGLMEQLQSTGENLMFYDPRTGRMRSKYPLGTMAMFSCQVTPDHHVVNLKIEQPSGYPDYDRAVYQAVKVLEGSSILRYPKNSRRKIVFEAAGIRTSMQGGPANFHWGDTEHIRIPGGQ